MAEPTDHNTEAHLPDLLQHVDEIEPRDVSAGWLLERARADLTKALGALGALVVGALFVVTYLRVVRPRRSGREHPGSAAPPNV